MIGVADRRCLLVLMFGFSPFVCVSVLLMFDMFVVFGVVDCV